jgi:hypothetical protein
MSSPLTLPQNGLRVGEQIVAEGDSVSLGNNVGVKNNLSVGGTLYANKVSSPFVTKTHSSNSDPLVIDCNYTQHAITLTGSPTGISFTNVPAASEGNYTVSVYLQQDVVGGRNISWANNTNFLWPNLGYVANNPVYPVLQTNPYRLDVFKFITFNGGQTWIAYQENPVAPQNADLASLQYALKSYNNMPGVVSTNSSQFSGSIVQIKQTVVNNRATFGASGSAFIDAATMTFYPKYKGSRLLMFSTTVHGVAGSAWQDDAVMWYFTVGTNIISSGLDLTNAVVNTANAYQAAHFGGYQYPHDGNIHSHHSGTTYYDHNAEPGTALDLRLRVKHADGWTGRNCRLGSSWDANVANYTAFVPITLLVMEYIP